MLPPEHLAYCSFCDQDWLRTTKEAAALAKANHEHLRHNQPMPAQEITGRDWQTQAVDAVRQVAARGKNFRIYDALTEFGLQSPPGAQHKLGRFTTLVHDLGIAHKVGSGPSSRPGTKGSDAGIWNRDPSRCVHESCRVKAGAA